MTSKNKICCNGIAYRQGFIEVQSDVHEGFVNIETWMIDSNVKITNTKNISALDINDTDFIGNTELELTIDQANELIVALQVAVAKIHQR